MRCPFCIKKCTKCGNLLVANSINFSKQKQGKHGVNSVCKLCKKIEKAKEYQDNKEYILNRVKTYAENNKDKIEEYRNKNRDKLRALYNKYNTEHREKRNKYASEYRKNNPEKIFNDRNNRRAKEEQGSGITKEQWKELMDYFNFKCAYSDEYIGGNSDKRTIDHIIPLNNNGVNEIWNCVPMHHSYNSSKKDKNPMDWYLNQSFYNEDRLTNIIEWQLYAFDKYAQEQDMLVLITGEIINYNKNI